MKTSAELEKQAALQVAALMAAAARTAPKTCGVDHIRVIAIDDEETRGRLIARMREISAAENRPGLARDAQNIAQVPAIVVVGVASNSLGLDCGFCGQPTCRDLEEAAGVCAFNSIDLGIATASAASVAATHHLDNRVMYSIGRACVDLGWLGPDVHQALGLPLSVTGKSPFFDRKA